MGECHIPFLGHLDLWLSLQNNRVQNISLILFEMGIPNLLYVTSLEADLSHIFRSVILTHDLVSRIIVSGAYLLYYLM